MELKTPAGDGWNDTSSVHKVLVEPKTKVYNKEVSLLSSKEKKKKFEEEEKEEEEEEEWGEGGGEKEEEEEELTQGTNQSLQQWKLFSKHNLTKIENKK